MRLISLVAMVLIFAILAGCEPAGIKEMREEKENKDLFEVVAFPGGSLLTDNKTGCQYIAGDGVNSGYTPRLDSTGHPMCGKNN